MKVDIPPNFAKEQKITKESRGVVTPQQVIFAVNDDHRHELLNDAGFKAVTSNKAHIYVHGILNYDDIFGHHHWITYCYLLEPDGKSFSAYKEHNDTDDK